MTGAGSGPTPRLAPRELVVVLENEHWHLEVLPGLGGSITEGWIRDGDGWLPVLRPTAMPVESSSPCADFVLVPWSNRIRDGVLLFDGTAHPLPHLAADGTAMHGVVRNAAWEIVAQSATALRLRYSTAERDDIGFPWPFEAELEYRLEGREVVVETLLRSTADAPFPAGIGHHPYFRRSLDGVEDVQLEIPASLSYRMERLMAVAEAQPIEERIDFRVLRPLGDAVVNDLLTGLDPTRPIRMVYPRSGHELRMHVPAVFGHVVAYAPQEGTDFYAIEPVTNANDGFTLREQGVAGHGVVVLDPGAELAGTFRLEVVS